MLRINIKNSNNNRKEQSRAAKKMREQIRRHAIFGFVAIPLFIFVLSSKSKKTYILYTHNETKTNKNTKERKKIKLKIVRGFFLSLHTQCAAHCEDVKKKTYIIMRICSRHNTGSRAPGTFYLLVDVHFAINKPYLRCLFVFLFFLALSCSVAYSPIVEHDSKSSLASQSSEYKRLHHSNVFLAGGD